MQPPTPAPPRRPQPTHQPINTHAAITAEPLVSLGAINHIDGVQKIQPHLILQ